MRIISRRRKNVNKTGILMRPDALILEPARTTSLSSSPFIPANSFFRVRCHRRRILSLFATTPWISFAELSTPTTTASTFFPSYVLVHSFYGSIVARQEEEKSTDILFQRNTSQRWVVNKE